MEDRAQGFSATRVLNKKDRELDLIPIRRKSLSEVDYTGRGREKSDSKEEMNAARVPTSVTVASMMLNVVMAVIIYILQAGPI